MEQKPDKIYYCYKATNDVNGKVYIGFAADPQKRWRQHKADSIKGRGYVFHDAIRKHGWHHFHFEVICCGKDKRQMLEHVEPFLIEQYQSNIGQNGYNMHKKVFGASSRENDLRGKRTEEQLVNFRTAAKRRMEDPETRKKVSESLKKYFIENGGSPKKGILLVPPKVPKLSLKYDASEPFIDFIQKHFLAKTGKLKPIFCRIPILQKFEIWDIILETTSFLPHNSSVAERIYCIQHQIAQRQLCFCGKPVNYVGMQRETKVSGYLTSCSPLCGRLHVLVMMAN